MRIFADLYQFWRVSALTSPIGRGAFAATMAIAFQASAHGQATGTVASPVVKPGSAFSLAGAAAFEGDENGFAHRFDYRGAVTDKVRVSAMLFFNDRRGDYRYRRLAVETLYQFADDAQGWSSAVQVRGFIPDGNDGAARLRMAWLNRWRPSPRTELRLIGLASREFGQDRDAGLALETRAEATWRIGTDTRIGAQIFNRYNTTASFGTFNTQRHSIGAVVKGAVTDTVSFRVNALAGISDAAADVELRARLRYSF